MPAFLWNLVVGAFFNWVSFMLRPKTPGVEAPAFEDVSIPISKQGQEFYILHGTNWVTDSQVAFFGDYNPRDVRTSTGKKG